MATQGTGQPALSDAERRRKRRRTVRNVLLGIVAVVFGAWLVLYVTKGRFLKRPFETLAGGALHRTIRVGGDFQFYFDPITLKFVAEQVRIDNPAWATRPELLTADRIAARIPPLSLLFGRRRFDTLDLVNARADLEWDRAHRHNSWTFGDPSKPGKPFELPRIAEANVTGTQVRYLDWKLKLLADLKLDAIRSTNANIGRAVGLTGRGQVRGTPFTLTAQLLTPDATVNRGGNRLRLEAHAAHNVIDVVGALPSLAEIENVPLAVRARGRNMAELLAIIGVAVPDTRAYTMAATLVQSGADYRFTRLAGRFGDSDLAGALTVTDRAPRVHIQADLRTRRLDIVDVASVIGYNPDVVASQGAVAAARASGAAPARILPDTPLRVDALGAFDADLHYTVGVVRSKNVPISNIALTLRLKDSELQLSPLTMSMARGDVAADIMIDAQRRPVHTSYDIRLSPTPLGRLLAGFGVIESGTTGTAKGRIRLEGDGDTIHDSLANSDGRIAFVLPSGTFWTRNVQLAELDIGVFVQKMFEQQLKEPVRINCGLVAFTVRNGIAAADPILIDTTKNVIAGRGGFSFKTEAIDLAIRADAKKFSLFSGQSPVGLSGTFAKPGINVISPQLLTRAGAAVGLGLVATPFAAVLAFVDIGDAKGAQCGPVLAGATAAQQRTIKGRPRTDVGHGTAAKDGGDAKAGTRKKFLGIF